MLDKIFDPQTIETRLYEEWERSGAFEAQPDSSKKPYVIMMPPPNVTGTLHIGHALNNTLQDILIRYHRMKGYDVLWQPGTDHAGIATQMVVERQLAAEGQTRHDLGRDKFIERVWKWKEESGGIITGQLRRLGATPDWSRERFTMDDGLSRAVRKVFVQLHKDKLIYKDKRLVNWDPKLHTAISDIEVVQKETKSKLWHINYPIEGAQGRFITVATTRPETLLGDSAVAVHPDDERYQDLIGKNAIIPIAGRVVPIVADEYADPEQGSGAVKITPAHDFNDFEVGKRHDLPLINVFDKNACLNENAPEAYQGLDRFKAREKILAELEEMGALAKIDDHVYQLPYGDRSGVVIEPWLTDQWYCDAPTMAKNAIKAVQEGDSVFIPKNWEKTYYEWMNNIQPWCISRQLWWGHQIPAWYAEDGTIFVEETEDEALKAAEKHFGQKVSLTQDADVLDTWFSSALWPFSTLGWPDKTPELDKYYPGSLLITGFDIIFFWVARMMMMSLHFMGKVPFVDIYMHALVRDEHGQKMSKSKGNVMDPLVLIDKFGADALRFTLTAMAAQGRDIKLSENRIEGYRNFATKLWNATRFCLLNEAHIQEDFDPKTVKNPVNQWIISETAQCAEALENAFKTYRFNEAANAIYQFAWGTFCDWYVEFSKPLLQSSEFATETKATTAWVLDNILKMLNPIMPFITEELYQALHEGQNKPWVLTQEWPDLSAFAQKSQAQEQVAWIIEMIMQIRSLRADMNIPASAKIRLLLKDTQKKEQDCIAQFNDILLQMARLDSVELTQETAPKGSIQSVLQGVTLILPVADVIDIDQEKERLQKEIKRLDGEIQRVVQKLANENFVSRAPDEVINEQKEKKQHYEEAKSKLDQALKQLGG